MKLITCWRKAAGTAGPRIHWLGFLAMVLGLAFIALKFRDQDDLLSRWRQGSGSIIALAISALLYGLACNLLAHGWERLMHALRCGDEAVAGSRKVYARSQIAKYLPGNVAHLLTRHVLLCSKGVAHRQLGCAAFLEVACVLAGASIVGAMGLLWSQTGGLGGFLLAIAAGALLVPFAAWLCRAIDGKVGSRSGCSRKRLPFAHLSTALVDYVVFFAVSAALFCWIIMSFESGVIHADFGMLAAAYAISWMAGFVVPGAPGGLGVREAVLIFLLRDTAFAGDVVLGVMLFRMVTISGDVVFFLMSFLPQALLAHLHPSGWLRTAMR